MTSNDWELMFLLLQRTTVPCSLIFNHRLQNLFGLLDSLNSYESAELILLLEVAHKQE